MSTVLLILLTVVAFWCVVALVVYCLCVAAKRADRELAQRIRDVSR